MQKQKSDVEERKGRLHSGRHWVQPEPRAGHFESETCFRDRDGWDGARKQRKKNVVATGAVAPLLVNERYDLGERNAPITLKQA